MLNITDIRIRLVEKEDLKLKAVASITIDNCFVIHEIKVISGERGLFIAMPSKKSKGEEFRDICHPINSETRSALDKAIVEAYEKALSEQATEQPKSE